MGKTSEIRGDRFETVNRRIARLMAAMIRRHVAGYGIPTIYLAGGTPCVPGIEEVVQEEVGIQVMKPHDPLLVTPMGVAMAC